MRGRGVRVTSQVSDIKDRSKYQDEWMWEESSMKCIDEMSYSGWSLERPSGTVIHKISPPPPHTHVHVYTHT